MTAPHRVGRDGLGVEPDVLVYYELTTSRDLVSYEYEQPPFSLLYRTREGAIAAATRWLESRPPEWLSYSHPRTTFVLPWSRKVRVESGTVILEWFEARRDEHTRHELRTVVVDGQEYRRDERIVRHGPWEPAVVRVDSYWRGAALRPIVFCVHVYVEERRIEWAADATAREGGR
jgi:hypothetical protein